MFEWRPKEVGYVQLNVFDVDALSHFPYGHRYITRGQSHRPLRDHFSLHDRISPHLVLDPNTVSSDQILTGQFEI